MAEVIALAELADLLGVSKQRAAILADRPNFPEPIAHLSVGRIWRTSAVQEWQAKRKGRDED